MNVKADGRSSTPAKDAPVEAVTLLSPSDTSKPEMQVLLSALRKMRDGDFSVRLPDSWTGLNGKVADAFNEIVGANQQMARELNRIGQAVGKEGRTRERTRFQQLRGSWGEIESSVNTLVEDLLRPTTEV